MMNVSGGAQGAAPNPAPTLSLRSFLLSPFDPAAWRAALAILITAGIIWALLWDSLNFIANVTIDQLFDGVWAPRSNRYDIPTLLIGTTVISLVGMLIAVPLGLGAAVYLAEYASPRLRGTLKPILEILAAIPSVVLGFFALTVISPNVIAPICEFAQGWAPSIFNMAAAGVAVGILITPLVASISEDALFAVPDSLREASYGADWDFTDAAFEGRYNDSANWSPTGEKMVYATRIGNYTQLVLINPTGEDRRLLTDRRWRNCEDPSWAPDGRHVVFASDRSGVFKLYAMDVVEGDARQLTFGDEPDITPAWSPR